MVCSLIYCTAKSLDGLLFNMNYDKRNHELKKN